MSVDLPTLMLAGSFVAAISGAFLIFAWCQNREAKAPLWWAGANLALATGVPLISSPGATFGGPSVVLGIVLLNLSPALVWAAAVSCNDRRPNPALVAAGATIWLFAFVAIFRLSSEAQMALNLGVISIYLLAAAAEFWLGNTRGLQTRWPLIVLLVLHGSFFAVGAVLAANGEIASARPTTLDSWFGLIHFETLAFVVGTAIFAVAMVKEQREMEQKTAARVDPLTGVANRRAFLENAEGLLQRSLASGKPLALIVFDLDRFKSINDNHGHAMGDKVLEQFGEATRHVLRSSDAVGRMGGEEFAVVLPGSDRDRRRNRRRTHSSRLHRRLLRTRRRRLPADTERRHRPSSYGCRRDPRLDLCDRRRSALSGEKGRPRPHRRGGGSAGYRPGRPGRACNTGRLNRHLASCRWPR